MSLPQSGTCASTTGHADVSQGSTAPCFGQAVTSLYGPLGATLGFLLVVLANYVWFLALALACWLGAIWLARGRRRQEVRALGIGLVVVGALVLLTRSLAGSYLVDSLVKSDSVKPAVTDAWNSITHSLAASGWAALAVGVLTVAGAWLVGRGLRPTSTRTAITPALRRAEIAWGAWLLGIGLVVWNPPLQVFRTTVLLVVASAIGFGVLRRRLAREAAGLAPPEDAGAAVVE
jgi:hypothetical protein